MNRIQDIACLDTAQARMQFCGLDKAGTGMTHEKLQKQFLEDWSLPEFRNTNPTYYKLVTVDWAVIGALTWANPQRRQCTESAAKGRLKDFNWLIKNLENRLELKRGSVAFYFKNEQSNGEGHAHFLLAETGLNGVPPELVCELLRTLWMERGKQQDGNGIRQTQVKIEPFDAARQKKGVSYVCKRERDCSGNIIDSRECLSNALKALCNPRQTDDSKGKTAKKPPFDAL